VLVVVGASSNTLGVSPFLFYFLDGSKKHINLIDNNLKNYLVAALPALGASVANFPFNIFFLKGQF
jgi:hypothetical protein